MRDNDTRDNIVTVPFWNGAGSRCELYNLYNYPPKGRQIMQVGKVLKVYNMSSVVHPP